MNAPSPQLLRTTLAKLLQAIEDVSDTDEEAFAVLDLMVREGRISVLGPTEIAIAA